jgi:hypothetical protein
MEAAREVFPGQWTHIVLNSGFSCCILFQFVQSISPPSPTVQVRNPVMIPVPASPAPLPGLPVIVVPQLSTMAAGVAAAKPLTT